MIEERLLVVIQANRRVKWVFGGDGCWPETEREKEGEMGDNWVVDTPDPGRVPMSCREKLMNTKETFLQITEKFRTQP